MRRLSIVVGALCSVLLAINSAEAQQRDYSVSGAASIRASKGLYNPYTLLGRKDVQAIVDEALKGPLASDRLLALLRGSEVQLDHLVETGVLKRLPDGRSQLAMTVLKAEDRVLLDRVSDPLGHTLAQAVLARRDEFDRILARYDLDGVDPAMVRMALIGCVMLDWDGLHVTAEQGFRTKAIPKANGDEYQMVLRERTAAASSRALYWGSHDDFAAGDTIRVSTFGDHHPGSKRLGFPDLTWIVGEGDFAAVARTPVTAQLAKAFSSEMRDSQEVAARIMRTLREGPRSPLLLLRRHSSLWSAPRRSSTCWWRCNMSN